MIHYRAFQKRGDLLRRLGSEVFTPGSFSDPDFTHIYYDFQVALTGYLPILFLGNTELRWIRSSATGGTQMKGNAIYGTVVCWLLLLLLMANPSAENQATVT